MKKRIFLIAILMILFTVITTTFVFSQLGYDNPNLPRVETPTPTVITFMNNTGQTNSSIFADIWLTNEGEMDNVPDLYPTLNVEFWRLDGTNAPPTAIWFMNNFGFSNLGSTNMTGDLNMGGNDINFSGGNIVSNSVLILTGEGAFSNILQLRGVSNSISLQFQNSEDPIPQTGTITFTGSTDTFTLNTDNLAIGGGAGNKILNFDTQINDGLITWMSSDDYFNISNDIVLESGKNITLTDGNISADYFFGNISQAHSFPSSPTINIFNQDLNTTSNVIFDMVNVTVNISFPDDTGCINFPSSNPGLDRYICGNGIRDLTFFASRGFFAFTDTFIGNGLDNTITLVLDTSSNDGKLIFDGSDNWWEFARPITGVAGGSFAIIPSNFDSTQNISFDTLFGDEMFVNIDDVTFNSDVNITKDLVVDGNTTIRGEINVTNNATFQKDVIIEGTLFGGSPLKVAGINVTSGNLDLNNGNFITTGTSTSGTLIANSNIQLEGTMEHIGDVDTEMVFEDDKITYTAGNIPFISIIQDAQNILVLNENSFDVDFRIESNADTHAFFLRGSDSKIGLGTANPLALLDINGDMILSGGTQSYSFADRLNTLTIQSQTSGTESLLELYTKDGDGTDELELRIWAIGTPSSITNREFFQFGYSPITNTFDIETQASGTGTARDIQIIDDGTTWMTFKAGGGIGIGTTNPQQLLELSGGGLKITGANDVETSANTTYIDQFQGIARFFSHGWDSSTRGEFQFVISDTDRSDIIEALFIQKDGNIGFGTTTPDMTLEIAGGLHIQDLEGTYSNGEAYVCVFNNGTIFVKDSACS